MSGSRVRENRMHGSMRRREATPASRPARAAPEASRRPYPALLGDDHARVLLRAKRGTTRGLSNLLDEHTAATS